MIPTPRRHTPQIFCCGKYFGVGLAVAKEHGVQALAWLYCDQRKTRLKPELHALSFDLLMSRGLI